MEPGEGQEQRQPIEDANSLGEQSGFEVSSRRPLSDAGNKDKGNPVEDIKGYLDEFKEFASNEQFIKRTEDLRKLIGIYQKSEEGIDLDSNELRFLYQVDHPIDNFDFGKDLGIEDLLEGRDKEKDILAIFGCESAQVVQDQSQINENTKVYIGQINKETLETLRKFKVDYIFTGFPGARIRFQDLEVESKSKADLKQDVESAQDVQSTGYAKELLGVEGFSTIVNKTADSSGLTQEDKDLLLKEHPKALDRNFNLVTLSIKDLGFSDASTIEEIYAKAKSLGLELCPPEVGPQLRLKLKDQIRNETVYIGMEPIKDEPGDPHIFSIARHEDELWLDDAWTLDTHQFDINAKFVFSLNR